MNKKISCAVSIITFSLMIAGCAPKGMSRDTYSLGKEAITIVENYNSGITDAKDAAEKLENIHDQLEDASSSMKLEERTKNLSVISKITDLKLTIEYGNLIDIGTSVEEALAELKTLLGK